MNSHKMSFYISIFTVKMVELLVSANSKMIHIQVLTTTFFNKLMKNIDWQTDYKAFN